MAPELANIMKSGENGKPTKICLLDGILLSPSDSTDLKRLCAKWISCKWTSFSTYLVAMHLRKCWFMPFASANKHTDCKSVNWTFRYAEWARVQSAQLRLFTDGHLQSASGGSGSGWFVHKCIRWCTMARLALFLPPLSPLFIHSNYPPSLQLPCATAQGKRERKVREENMRTTTTIRGTY